MQMFSAGQVVAYLGIHRDVLQAAIRGGAPEASFKIGNRRAFTKQDIEALYRWFQAQGRPVIAPTFDKESIIG
jgi:hypothetical protein